MKNRNEKRIVRSLTAALNGSPSSMDAAHRALAELTPIFVAEAECERLRVLRETVELPRLLLALGIDEKERRNDIAAAIAKTHGANEDVALWVVIVWAQCAAGHSATTSRRGFQHVIDAAWTGIALIGKIAIFLLLGFTAILDEIGDKAIWRFFWSLVAIIALFVALVAYQGPQASNEQSSSSVNGYQHNLTAPDALEIDAGIRTE